MPSIILRSTRTSLRTFRFSSARTKYPQIQPWPGHLRVKSHEWFNGKSSAESFCSLPTRHDQTHGKTSPTVTLLFVITCSLVFGAWNFRQSSTTRNDAPTPDNRDLDRSTEGVTSATWKGMVYPALDMAAATLKLRAEQTSSTLRTSCDTSPSRFDTIRVPSNNPSEDEKSVDIQDVGDTEDWRFWGVYDGHAGWATSQILKRHLTTYVAQSLRKARQETPSLSPEAIDNAIKASFVTLDDEIISDGLNALTDAQNHAEAISRIAPARAGSCALLAIFDPQTSNLRVACTGDSRAVLGRHTKTPSPSPSNSNPNTDEDPNPESKTPTQPQPQPQSNQTPYTAEPLSIDQTGFNTHERDRISQAHPNEPDAIDLTSGRLLGMAVTRAFGDHRWKWPLEAIQTCRENFYGTSPRPKYISPPYMTAEPEITTTRIKPGDFLILATDGLWDHMSSEDAVECVGRWIEHQHQWNRSTGQSISSGPDAPAGSPVAPVQSQSQQPHPPHPPPEPQSKPDVATQNPEKFSYDYRGTPEHFVVEDENVATHLVRNALGGSRRELFCSVLSVQAPESRSVRDDITVQVVFFGDVLGTKKRMDMRSRR